MAPEELARREFLVRSAAGVGALGAMAAGAAPAFGEALAGGALPEYRGPNVILIRFGGGVRRLETINADGTYAPYFLKELAPKGTLYTNMMIEQIEGVETSHGQGTLYLLTGKYDKFKDINGKFLGARFESKVPTLFEYFRKAYNIAEHEALIINGEDRTDEEFYSFSNHHLFGANYRSTTLSLYRFKVHLLRRQLERGGLRAFYFIIDTKQCRNQPWRRKPACAPHSEGAARRPQNVGNALPHAARCPCAADNARRCVPGTTPLDGHAPLYGVDRSIAVACLQVYNRIYNKVKCSRDQELKKKTADLTKFEALDYRLDGSKAPLPEITRFWDDWRAFYGDSGFVNARGDRLLTQIAMTAMEKLRPRLMMINYNDPDYVHWGNPSHYTRGISTIDQGIHELMTAVEADEHYRGNTVFVIVPDCGRDSNRALAVPFQHHFNSRSAHEIFALFIGPGIARGHVIDREVQQISVASTLGGVMKVPMEFTEGAPLDEVFA